MQDIEDLYRSGGGSEENAIECQGSKVDVTRRYDTNVAVRLKEMALIPSKAFSLDGTEDNCAVATRTVPEGTKIRYEDRTFRISHTVLEGHRFCIRDVKQDEQLLSWGMPFAVATETIAPGTYLCNDRIVKALRGRGITYALPETSNFQDILPSYDVENAIVAENQIDMLPEGKRGHFRGFRRGGDRGVGTRTFRSLSFTTLDGVSRR